MTMPTSPDPAPVDDAVPVSVHQLSPPPPRSAGRTVALLVTAVLLAVVVLPAMGVFLSRLEGGLSLPKTLDGLDRNPTLEANGRAEAEQLSKLFGEGNAAFAVYGTPDRVLSVVITRHPMPEAAMREALERSGSTDVVTFDDATCGHLPDERVDSEIACFSGGFFSASMVVEVVPRGQASDPAQIGGLAADVRP